MRVAIINKHVRDTIGGSEVQCDFIATALAARGHEVSYLAVHPRRTRYDASYPVVPLPSLSPARLYAALKRLKPDVVYWRHNRQGLLAAAVAARLAGAPFVYSMSHVRDSLLFGSAGRRLTLRETFSKQGLLRLREKLLSAVNYLAVYFLTDGVVSNNASYIGGMPVRRKAVIRNTMTTEAVPFAWPRPYVAWVANLKRRKNPDAFFRLAQELQDEGVDFLMVGNIQDPVYVERTREWNEAPNFRYLGRKSLLEVNGFLAGSLFLAHTCEPEGFPNNCIQAWLQEKPVLSLHFDPEGLLAQEGIGYHSGDFETFKRQARDLIRTSSLRTEIGARAKAFAEREFAREQNIAKLEAFLASVLPSTNGGRRDGK